MVKTGCFVGIDVGAVAAKMAVLPGAADLAGRLIEAGLREHRSAVEPVFLSPYRRTRYCA